MADFDPQVARLANITRSSLARVFQTESRSLWDAGVRQELRAWLSLGVTLEFFPTDSQHLEILTRAFALLPDADEFPTFDEWSTLDKIRLHPYVQSALLLADHLHADSVACRLLSTIAFHPEDSWTELLGAQRRLVAALPQPGFDSLIQVAQGGAWLFDGTVRVLHHLRAFHYWAQAAMLDLTKSDDWTQAPPLVRAVAQLQQWRLDVSADRSVRRLREVVDAAQDAAAILLAGQTAADLQNERTDSDSKVTGEPIIHQLDVPTVIFGVRMPMNEV